jgi:hypothetical protein
MRRRIERSRARCEKAVTNHKTDNEQKADTQPSRLTATSSLERDEKGG